MKLIRARLLVATLFFAFGLIAQNSKLKVSSFDLDFGIYGNTNWYEHTYTKNEMFNVISEYTPGNLFSQVGMRSSAAVPTISASVNLSPFSKKRDGFNSQQSLRLTAGLISETYQTVVMSREWSATPYDTLLIETTSSSSGVIDNDTVFRLKTVNNYHTEYIMGYAIKLGGQYLFSTSKKMFQLTVGPGLDANINVSNSYQYYRTSWHAIESQTYNYDPIYLDELYASSLSTVKTSAFLSVVPHVALFLSKSAKKRDSWLDGTSIYLSGIIGTQFYLTNKYDLSPDFVFSTNFGFRYSL